MGFIKRWKQKRQEAVLDYIMYHIFAHCFDYDIEAYLEESEKRARELGGEHVDDLDGVKWLKGDLEKDPDLVNRIRRMVEGE